jgi:hypothetical protein
MKTVFALINHLNLDIIIGLVLKKYEGNYY